MFALKQQVVQKSAVALIVVLLLCSTGYTGLLTNWFRYNLSLEATFVLLPVLIGAFISGLLAVMAYIKGSPHNLIGAVAVAFVAAVIVATFQMQTFGHMPSFSINDVRKSPVGYLTTPHGNLAYWIELVNPYARSHREYLVIEHDKEHYRISVPIFDAPLSAFASPVSATDWGELTMTSNPDILVLTIGPFLIQEGRFQINLRSQKAERKK